MHATHLESDVQVSQPRPLLQKGGAGDGAFNASSMYVASVSTLFPTHRKR